MKKKLMKKKALHDKLRSITVQFTECFKTLRNILQQVALVKLHISREINLVISATL